jgi:mRNA-degrading endonuclease toxin of MazEF toxin-antitoxin module
MFQILLHAARTESGCAADHSKRGDLKRLVPDKGNILPIDSDPTRGREQSGKRPVLVLSLAELHRFGLVLSNYSGVTLQENTASQFPFQVVAHGPRVLRSGAHILDELARVRVLLD